MSYRFIAFFQFPLLLLYFIFFNENISAQNNIGVGTTTPNPKAIFDIFSTDKGFLLPRMTTIQRNAIAPSGNADVGLLVYDTNDNLYYYWNAAQWVPFPQASANSFNINTTFDNNTRVFSITDGSGTLTTTIPDNDNQTLSLNGQQLSISDGNSVILPTTTDNQTLSIAGNVISISNGNSITLPTFIDTDAQTLTLNGNTLSISNGNSVTLPIDADSDPLNEIQTLNITQNGNAISWQLSNNGGNGNFNIQDNDWSGAGTGSMTTTTTNDNVGIGINPTEKLSVAGNLLLNGALKGSVRIYNNETAIDVTYGNANAYATQSPVTLSEGTWYITVSGRMSDRGTPDRIRWGIRNVTDNLMVIEGTTFTDDEYDLFTVSQIVTIPVGQTKTYAIAAWRGLANNGVYMGPTATLAVRID
jgi:hypothetical protein